MKLIGTRTSPFVRKVRVVLAEKKLECELVVDDVWSPESTVHEINPLGKVPCLVMDDGKPLFDSRVIVEYLDTLTPVGKLLSGIGRVRTETKTWEALADGMLDAAILVLMEKRRPAQQQSQEWIDRQWRKIHATLDMIAVRLKDRAFCIDRQYSLADIALACALDWLSFRFPELSWRGDYPELATWLDKITERPSFRDTAPQAA